MRSHTFADVDPRLARDRLRGYGDDEAGRTIGALDVINSRRKARAELVAQRQREADVLTGLKVEKAAVNGERRSVEADLGPVRYLPTLLGQPTRWCCGGSSS